MDDGGRRGDGRAPGGADREHGRGPAGRTGRSPAGVVAGPAQLRDHDGPAIRADLLAGLAVAAYLVPQCLAYAELAGVEPVAGLWVAVAGMLAYALLGSSRRLSVGPESTTAIMVAAAVAPLAAGDPARHAALAAALAILVGVACCAAWALRLGFVADLLSRPILLGYLAGVAVLMIASQAGALTGLELAATDLPGRAVELLARLPELHLPTLAIALGVLALLVALRRAIPLAPGPLVAVAGAGAVVAALGLEERGVALAGAVRAGLPQAGLPAVDAADLAALAASAVAIALVAYGDVALTGRAFAERHAETIDPNREFLALGAGNLAAGLVGGFALSASGSRTALADAAGGRSQATGLVAAAVVLLVVLAAPGLIERIPVAALAGVVVYAALRLVDLRGIARLGRLRSTELALALSALAGVLLLGVLAGILVAVALSVADLLARVARPPAAILGRVPGLAGLHNVEDYPDAEEIEGLVVFRYDAPLCFANAEDFRQRALAAVTGRPVPPAWLLVNAESIVELDTTAADALRRLAEELGRRGIVLAFARVKRDLREQLARGGLLDVLDERRFHPTLPVALAAFEAWRGRGGDGA